MSLLRSRKLGTLWVVFFACVLLAFAAGARADGDRIWGVLILATNEELPRPVPEDLEKYASALKEIFGYNSFDALNQKKRDLTPGGRVKLNLSHELFVKVQCLEKADTTYKLRLEVYQREQLLVTVDAKLARGAPLYIRGPLWGDGQLIILLEVL